MDELKDWEEFFLLQPWVQQLSGYSQPRAPNSLQALPNCYLKDFLLLKLLQAICC